MLTYQEELYFCPCYAGRRPSHRRSLLNFQFEIHQSIFSSFLSILSDLQIQLEREHLQQEEHSLAVIILRSNDDVQLRRHCRCGSEQEARIAELQQVKTRTKKIK